MKQIVQDLATGKMELLELPAHQYTAGKLLIQTRSSVISSGTERMLVDFARGNWLEKVRQQPDKVRMVLDKMRTDGILPTVEAVRAKLDAPMPLGYCNAGVVVGSGVDGFAAGDRVVSNGPHASMVSVPANLCAKIPEAVSDEAAAFTVLGAIAMQSVRLANPTVGEAVAVSGLGLVGLLCVQILRANGCRVLGIDLDSRRCALAAQFGAEVVNPSEGQHPVAIAQSFSRGRGMDAVIIAAATKSSEPMRQAAHMSRKRGRVVLVGVVGLELTRADFYEKELTFQVSCSYGPGRYDPFYEDKGQDYPVGFVRWTEQRNFEAVLDLMAGGSIDVEPLITHRYAFDDALDAYEQLDAPDALGILLEYPEGTESESRVELASRAPPQASGGAAAVSCGFLGGGNYAARILLPAFQSTGARMHTLVTGGGLSAVHHGRKRGFVAAATDADHVYDNSEIDTVVIATRHNLHAAQALAALGAGKHVFVEKPLAMTLEELDSIEEAWKEAAPRGQALMVGFNRRFAQQVVKMRSLLDGSRSPKSFIYTVNAGAIPADHWTQDPAVGGGRIIGEACHFIDLLRFLAGHPIIGFTATQIGDTGTGEIRDDKVSISLSFEDGSFGTIHYLANGHKSFPKERLEVFGGGGGGVLQLDNFKKLQSYGWPGFSGMNLWSQDKGNRACVAAFVRSLQGGEPAPIPVDELFEVSRVTIQVAESLVH